MPRKSAKFIGRLLPHTIRVLLVAAGCVLSDQLSKSWAVVHLISGQIKPFLPGFVQLRLATNTGGAFSLGAGHNELMTILVVLFILGIMAWIGSRLASLPPPSKLEQIGMGFLLGGACGNLWNRLTLGQVIDFLDFTFINFPIFNLADVYVDTGLILILLSAYFYPSARTSKSENTNSGRR